MKNFINTNRTFWSELTVREGGSSVLIEDLRSPMIFHGNGVMTILLNQARNLTPVWIASKKDLPLFQSYVPTAQCTQFVVRHFLIRYWIFAQVLLKFIKVLLTRNILTFSFDGVRYGDIAYDAYLAQERAATIRRIDGKLFWIFYSIATRHNRVLYTLRRGNFEGILVSHQVGIHSGVLLRSALRGGYKGYLRGGHDQQTLQCFRELDDVYNYAYQPSVAELEICLDHYGDRLDDRFDLAVEKQLGGKGDPEAEHAFFEDNAYYDDRTQFCRDFELDPNKKNIFIMLHAMNDYPHSHFRGMVFKDYYDWFYKTLQYAKQNSSVNWIFKQHPCVAFYPTRDVNFEQLFVGCGKHIVYISEHQQINTKSLIHCADAVVTCLGSAGFELPAMASVPSVAASDNPYTNLGFALEPKTHTEYFKILSDMENIGKISKEQQRRARAAYLFIYHLSRVPMECFSVLSLSKHKDEGQDQWYWDGVLDLYENKRSEIFAQINDYISEIACENFSKLPEIEFSLQRDSFLQT